MPCRSGRPGRSPTKETRSGSPRHCVADGIRHLRPPSFQRACLARAPVTPARKPATRLAGDRQRPLRLSQRRCAVTASRRSSRERRVQGLHLGPQNHPRIAPRLDQPVGTPWAQSATSTLPDRVLWSLLLRSGEYDERFDAAFHDLLTWLTRDTEPYVHVAPLLGLDSDTAVIEIEPGVEIAKMTDQEVIACLTNGLISTSDAQGRSAHVPLRHAIRIREEWPIVVGVSAIDVDAGFQDAERNAARIEQLVHILRLLKDGAVGVVGTLSFVPIPYGVPSAFLRQPPFAWLSRQPLGRPSVPPGCDVSA